MLHGRSFGELPLEPLDVGAADEGVVANHSGDRGINFAFDVLILELKISEGNRHVRLYIRSRRAGLPAYTPATVISLVTTAPAPITTSSTICTGRMVAFEPMDTRLPILVSHHNSLRPRAGPPLAKVSLMNMTPWPMKQSSPTVTSSQMKLCDCTRVRAPITTPFWISLNGPMKQPPPIVQP